MKTKAVTFSQFESVLKNLGFDPKVIPETGIAYVHLATKEYLMVRFHEPTEAAPWHVLTAARRHFDSWGIIEAADFERMLKAAAA